MKKVSLFDEHEDSTAFARWQAEIGKQIEYFIWRNKYANPGGTGPGQIRHHVKENGEADRPGAEPPLD